MGRHISIRASIRGLVIGLVAVSLVFSMSCKASVKTTPPTTTITTPPTTTTTPPPTTTTTTPPTTIGATWGELVGAGSGVFGICASCHGEDGLGDFGPAIIGSSLGKFDSAQELFDFISESMPQDAPGSLTDREYLQVLAYLLVTSNFVQPEVVFDESNLDAIPIR